MPDGLPPPEESRRAGYEVRDASAPIIVGSGLILILAGVCLHLLLWEIHRASVPGVGQPGVSPPVAMPGEAPVGERMRSVPQPRLDPLTDGSPTQYPEDLRANRQPRLQGYEWVGPGKVARIPIDRAMDVMVERANASRKKGGGK